MGLRAQLAAVRHVRASTDPCSPVHRVSRAAHRWTVCGRRVRSTWRQVKPGRADEPCLTCERRAVS